MGYEQELSLTFTKPAKDEAEAKEFQAEVSKRVKEAGIDPEWDEPDFADGDASMHFYSYGRGIYDTDSRTGDALLGGNNVSARELTRELGCGLSIEYHGEERGDDDERTFEKGELVHKWENIQIEVTNPEVEEFNRLIDGIKKKGLEKEAEELRAVVTRMAARYLFSSGS